MVINIGFRFDYFDPKVFVEKNWSPFYRLLPINSRNLSGISPIKNPKNSQLYFGPKVHDFIFILLLFWVALVTFLNTKM